MRSIGRTRTAFTLVELLVVITIIGILTSLILPAVQAARESARKSQCINNLKQVGMGLTAYNDVHNQLPFNSMSFAGQNNSPNNGAMNGRAGDKGNVFVKILPHLDQQPLYDLMRASTENWRTPAGLQGRRYRKVDSTPIMMSPNETGFDPNDPDYVAGEQFDQMLMPILWCPSTDAPRRNEVSQVSLTCYAVSMGAQRMNDDDHNTGCETLGAIVNEGDYFNLGQVTNNINRGDTQFGRFASGPFSRTYFGARLGQIPDGMSNTFLAGEILPNRYDRQYTYGWMSSEGVTASTAAPCNAPTQCYGCPAMFAHSSVDPNRQSIGHACAEPFADPYAYGFKSMHTSDGANMVMGDGSVHYIFHSVDYELWNAMGARHDGLTTIVPE